MALARDFRSAVNRDSYKFVIIGGGIAGFSCQEALSQLNDEDPILLISASPLVKIVSHYERITDNLQRIDVTEQPVESTPTGPNVTIIQDGVVHVKSLEHEVQTKSGRRIRYDRLCICTGGKPKVICDDNPHVLGIRDTESVKEFLGKLSSARRVVIVGNGGIATELVYEIEDCEVVWAIKDDSIVSAFVDCGAGHFFLDQLSRAKKTEGKYPIKRLKYTVHGGCVSGKGIPVGSALGPDWLNDRTLRGVHTINRRIHVERSVEVVRVWSRGEFTRSSLAQLDPFTGKVLSSTDDDWPVFIELTNRKIYGCDFIVSATGVTPNVDSFSSDQQFSVSEQDGGLKVNDRMMTNIPHIYAAGDVASADWTIAPHWLQMRLWTQARQMGAYAAKCMSADVAAESVHMDICFEIFAHATKFFNYKVILLGRFNGQGLGTAYEMLVRVVEGVEYVKVILVGGRMQGAILIGETDLEETFENLILNQTDLSQYGDDLLNANIDIQDYFD